MSTTSPDMSQTDVVVPGMRGTVVDYFTDKPVAGLTVVDGDNTTTTDANGNWELPTTGPLAPAVSGPTYSTLYLPEATPGSVEVENGAIPIPSVEAIGLEQQLLGSDSTKALVQVTVVQEPTCASIAGGTITVVSPADAKVAYFTSQKLPTANSFIDGITGHRPVAVIYESRAGRAARGRGPHAQLLAGAAEHRVRPLQPDRQGHDGSHRAGRLQLVTRLHRRVTQW